MWNQLYKYAQYLNSRSVTSTLQSCVTVTLFDDTFSSYLHHFPPVMYIGSFKCRNAWGGHDNHVTSLMMSQHCNSISAPWWNPYWGCSGLESRLPWSKEKLSHVIDASIDLQHLQTTIDSDKYNMKIIIQWWSGFLHWWRQTVTIRSMVHFNCLLINRTFHGILQSMLN